MTYDDPFSYLNSIFPAVMLLTLQIMTTSASQGVNCMICWTNLHWVEFLCWYWEIRLISLVLFLSRHWLIRCEYRHFNALDWQFLVVFFVLFSSLSNMLSNVALCFMQGFEIYNRQRGMLLYDLMQELYKHWLGHWLACQAFQIEELSNWHYACNLDVCVSLVVVGEIGSSLTWLLIVLLLLSSGSLCIVH